MSLCVLPGIYSTITKMKLLQNFSRSELLAKTPDTGKCKCKCKCYEYILVFRESWQMRKKSRKKYLSGISLLFCDSAFLQLYFFASLKLFFLEVCSSVTICICNSAYLKHYVSKTLLFCSLPLCDFVSPCICFSATLLPCNSTSP